MVDLRGLSLPSSPPPPCLNSSSTGPCSEILHSLAFHLGSIVSQKLALGPSLGGAIALNRAAVPRMTYPNRWPGDSARMVSARAARGRHVSGLEMDYRCMVAGIDVPRFQLIVRAQGHRA